MDFKLSEGVQQAAELSQSQAQNGPEVVALQAGDWKVSLHLPQACDPLSHC